MPSPRAAAAVPTSYGELQPVGGGDPIPLLKQTLVVGRRESSDIVLRFPNVSGTHCELTISSGHWFVKDLGSSNGTKINGTRVSEGRLDPGDKVSFGRHEYEVCYDPGVLGSDGSGALAAPLRDIFSRSLLASAGLESRRAARPSRPRP
ncbi:MAG: FHA domain-containing protein [Planctomycetia bacterium]